MTTDLLAPGTTLERLGTAATWAEGPVWLPNERALRFSDIPANRILQWSEATGSMYRRTGSASMAAVVGTSVPSRPAAMVLTICGGSSRDIVARPAWSASTSA